MSEELQARILSAYRALLECAESGDPLAADETARAANGRLNAERCRWGVDAVTESRAETLDAVLLLCEKARDAFNAHAARKDLRTARDRLKPLADEVKAMRRAELCFAE